MLFADGQTNTEERIGLIKHGFVAGEWVAVEDEIGETVYGRWLPMSRQSFVRLLPLPQS